MSSSQAIAQRLDTHLQGWRLALVRVSWGAVALFGVGSFVARLPGHYADLQRVCPGSLCAYGQLRPEAVRSLQALNLSLGGYAVLRVSLTVAVTLTWFVVAAVLAWRRSDDWHALLVALWFVFVGAATITGAYGLGSTVQAPELSAHVVNYAARFGGFSLVLALFPTRRIVPRAAFSLLVLFAYFVAGPPLFAGSLTLAFRLGTLAGLALAQLYHYHVWRVSTPEPAHLQRPHAYWAALRITVLIGLVAVLLVTAPLGRSLALLIWYGTVTGLMILQLVRYWRVAGPLERQQTKWAAFGLSLFYALALSLLAPALFMPSLGQSGSSYETLHTLILIMASVLESFAIAFAILRYRLWDIDIIIRRTLVYGTLTALLAAIYFAGVVGTQALLNALTGHPKQQSPVVVVLTTLVIAALVTPLRRRIQTSIDRRFYRRKYDAAKTLAAFSAMLRTETDLERLSEHVAAVVEQTMQPAHVSLWLRESEPRPTGGAR